MRTVRCSTSAHSCNGKNAMASFTSIIKLNTNYVVMGKEVTQYKRKVMCNYNKIYLSTLNITTAVFNRELHW